MENKRNYGIDLLKALSMFGVVCMHITNAGGTWIEGTFLNPSSLVLRFFGMFFVCSVNIFAMITGYLYVKKDSVKYSNLLNLMFTVIFWCLLITGVAYLFTPQYLEGISLTKCLSPFGSGTYWYFKCYILLFIFIPFLNKLALSINQKQYCFLLLALFLTMCCLTSVIQKDLFVVAGGYSSLWLMVCYLVGAYIGLYAQTIKPRPIIWSMVPILNTLTLFALFIIAMKLFGSPVGYSLLVSYVSPLTVVNAICLVLFFSQLKIENKLCKKIIASTGKSSFSVYIAHGHEIIFVGVFGRTFAFLSDFNPILALGIWIGTAVAIYVAIWGLDMLRQQIFKLTRLNALSAKIGACIDKYTGFN